MVVMKSLTVGVFNDSDIGKLLGKKDTESDIVLYNRKDGDSIYTFMEPVDDKLSPKSQIMGTIDAAVVSFENPSKGLGETILMLDAMKVKHGVVVVTPGADLKQVLSMTKDTSLESFTVRDRDQHHILNTLSRIEPESGEETVTSVAVDHSFSVKGVGEVVLGFVKTGTVRKHQKLKILPGGKEILIRSIQMHDKDYDEAATGSRVGLCIKGAAAEEMKRGTVLCEPGLFSESLKVDLNFKANEFYDGGPREGSFHSTVGMQTFPVTLSSVSDRKITIEADRPFVYKKDDTFMLLDLNAEKVRIIGSGKVLQ